MVYWLWSYPTLVLLPPTFGSCCSEQVNPRVFLSEYEWCVKRYTSFDLIQAAAEAGQALSIK